MRATKYTFILFDLDGTLTYSHPGIYESLRYALKGFGFPEPTEKQLRACVGPPLQYAFGTIFGAEEKMVPALIEKYRERYSTLGWCENQAIPGAKTTMEKLKEAGYTLAIATSKPKIFAEKIAEKFGFFPYISVLEGSGTDGSLPSKADVIFSAMAKLGARKEDCLMVGDRKHDAEGAGKCGVDFAALDVGYADEGELAACSPRYLCRSFDELEKILLG